MTLMKLKLAVVRFFTFLCLRASVFVAIKVTPYRIAWRRLKTSENIIILVLPLKL